MRRGRIPRREPALSLPWRSAWARRKSQGRKAAHRPQALALAVGRAATTGGPRPPPRRRSGVLHVGPAQPGAQGEQGVTLRPPLSQELAGGWWRPRLCCRWPGVVALESGVRAGRVLGGCATVWGLRGCGVVECARACSGNCRHHTSRLLKPGCSPSCRPLQLRVACASCQAGLDHSPWSATYMSQRIGSKQVGQVAFARPHERSTPRRAPPLTPTPHGRVPERLHAAAASPAAGHTLSSSPPCSPWFDHGQRQLAAVGRCGALLDSPPAGMTEKTRGRRCPTCLGTACRCSRR